MQTLLVGIAIIGASVVLAHLGLRVVRRRVPLTVLETQHEVAGFMIGVLGAFYAVLLAFVVVLVWDQYGEAKAIIEREANKLTDLSRIAQGFTAPVRQRVFEGLENYGRAVIDDEWETMSRGQRSLKAENAIDHLWRVYGESEPQTNRENALYAASLDAMIEVSDSRRLRVHASSNDMPVIVKILLWTGGIITVGFTYFFGVKSVKSQALMTAALAGEVAFILFLIVALDNPFSGYVRLPPEPMQHALEKIHSIRTEGTINEK